MSKESQTSAASSHVQPGAKCLLSVLDRHFMVEILGVEHDTLRVSFPGVDYPVDGMKVDLEFHDNTGFFCYHSNVLQGPQSGATALCSRCPRNAPATSTANPVAFPPTSLFRCAIKSICANITPMCASSARAAP